MATRWRWPPERAEGARVASAGRGRRREEFGDGRCAFRRRADGVDVEGEADGGGDGTAGVERGGGVLLDKLDRAAMGEGARGGQGLAVEGEVPW